MGKLIIVSNRLPVTVSAAGDGLEFKASAGGLATGLSSFHQQGSAVWIGWPGTVPARHQPAVRDRLRNEYGSEPVFIPPGIVERFYEGYANRTLWPLFHSFPMYTRYSAADWKAYEEVNQLFYQAVRRVAKPGDQIWVHDYQLMLLPGLLRASVPDAAIGFFLHIPFPPYDILRLLPQHRPILESLLGADLVGFHTYDYMDAFLSSVRQVLGHENASGQVTLGNRAVEVDVFPMGIDFQRFASTSQHEDVVEGAARLQARSQGMKIIFSVSRLDYTKGIPQHLEALDYLLEHYPEWRGKLIFILSVVPSREKVERYVHLKREIDEMVGSLNSKYADLEWAPIWYMYRHVPFPELLALYLVADVGLVLPLRDGMNLVAKEYVAVQGERGGVLVLSETAGAAKELRQAIIVNPNSREDVADALNRAFTMPGEERLARGAELSEWLAERNVTHWAQRFLARLQQAASVSDEMQCQRLDEDLRGELLDRYATARRRLLMLDYDGTLTPFAGRPEDAVPSPELLEVLARIASDPRNELVVISGRTRDSLGAWLGHLQARLVAEHGAWLRARDGGIWELGADVEDGWKEQIKPLLERYVERIPGSLVEEKTFSLAWHYRQADVGTASIAARELIDSLTNLTANTEIGVLQGNKVVEVKNENITKGGYYRNNLWGQDWDFELAIGDDWTDESLFRLLPEQAYSIKVGLGPSAARFRLASPAEVLALLQDVAATTRSEA